MVSKTASELLKALSVKTYASSSPIVDSTITPSLEGYRVEFRLPGPGGIPSVGFSVGPTVEIATWAALQALTKDYGRKLAGGAKKDPLTLHVYAVDTSTWTEFGPDFFNLPQSHTMVWRREGGEQATGVSFFSCAFIDKEDAIRVLRRELEKVYLMSFYGAAHVDAFLAKPSVLRLSNNTWCAFCFLHVDTFINKNGHATPSPEEWVELGVRIAVREGEVGRINDRSLLED